MRSPLLAAALLALVPLHCAHAQHHPAPHGHPPPRQGDAGRPYAPFEALLGEWEVAPEGGRPMAVQRYRWGLDGAYIWYGTSLLGAHGGEQPHFEGMLVWNGVDRALDTLVSLHSPSGTVLERGTLTVTPSGTFVRDVVAYYSPGAGVPGAGPAGPQGATVRFRQTLRPVAPGRMMSSTLRESEEGWVPTFPGMDRMVMTRRGAAGAGR
jgi:hypothetical protein